MPGRRSLTKVPKTFGYLLFSSVDLLSLLEASFTIVVPLTSFPAISRLPLECENVTVTLSIYQEILI